MTDMSLRLITIIPEIVLFAGAVIVSILGLSPAKQLRDAVPAITAAFLFAALVIIPFVSQPDRVADAGHLLPNLGMVAKMLIAGVSLLLVAVGAGAVDRRLEESIARGRSPFDPVRVLRGEYHAFLLLSVSGAMLLASASDLIWLFLALELSSLPTYVMVAISRGTRRAQEAAVKYFFLGAMAAAMVLYGFALLYGSTGTLRLVDMHSVFSAQIAAGGVDGLAIIGAALVILGLTFKITAVPMHFYAPDVYEGAGVHVTAFLSFIPKVAGFITLIMVLSTIGWEGHRPGADGALLNGLPLPLTSLLWMLAVMTMTLGNIGALLQRSVKRMLAYSSIAHSGYMLIGIIVGPALGGFDALFFYLVCYGLMNTAVFGALAAIERSNGDEVDSFDDLSGLWVRHPMVAAMLAAGAGSLVGLPPLLGFWGKLDLFIAGINDAQTVLIVIAAVNSAISAWYYLRLAGLPIVGVADRRAELVVSVPSRWPKVAAVICGLGVIVLPLPLVDSIIEASAVVGAERRGVAQTPLEPMTDPLPEHASQPLSVAPTAPGEDAAADAPSPLQSPPRSARSSTG
ncbi:MAG: NADH-quinone oxidoreductase subunit N [Phycisphaeraceae bacterium]|nr:NADH-quinone oxidoreductase subunit N [Phycisphaeraceae bacterium]